MKCGDSIIKGDVVIIIHEIQHSVYHRIGNDLIIKEILMLEEAISGYSRILTHLKNDNMFKVQSPKDQIIAHGSKFYL